MMEPRRSPGLMVIPEESPRTLQAMSMWRVTPMEVWTEILVQVARMLSWSSTTAQGRNIGPSRWGPRLMILPMESPQTPQTMSMWQVGPMELLTAPTQETVTCLW